MNFLESIVGMSMPGPVSAAAGLVGSYRALCGLPPESDADADQRPSAEQRTHRAAKPTSSAGGATGRAGGGKVDRSAPQLKLKPGAFSHLLRGAEERRAQPGAPLSAVRLMRAGEMIAGRDPGKARALAVPAVALPPTVEQQLAGNLCASRLLKAAALIRGDQA